LTHVGKRLRDLRVRAGLKREELATAAGVGYGTIAMIEAGRARNPKLDTIRRLARAIGEKTGKNELEVLGELIGEGEVHAHP